MQAHAKACTSQHAHARMQTWIIMNEQWCGGLTWLAMASLSQFASVTDGLSLSGMIMAKRFLFLRTAQSTTTAATWNDKKEEKQWGISEAIVER